MALMDSALIHSELPDFELSDPGEYVTFLEEKSIRTFHELCHWITYLPYGRTSSRSDFKTLFTEGRGTCSLKHGFLSLIADLNGYSAIELLVGIYLLNAENTPSAAEVLHEKGLNAIPEAHVYLRYEGKRYDFTSSGAAKLSFAPFIVREQRCEVGQLAEWKPNIHRNFIESWQKRNQITYSPEELWTIREAVIKSLQNG